MLEILPDVYRMTDLRMANVYLLVTGEDLFLVDSGMPGDVKQIEAQMQEQGFALSALRTIVLTHAHVDHVGSVPELVRRSGAQVLAHAQEVPYVERTQSLPAASLPRRIMNWFSERMMGRQPACHVDRALEDGETVAALGGLHVLHTPGHTPGSICLYQPERQILFTGDTLFNRNPMTDRRGLQLPPSMLITDRAALLASVRRLADLPVQVLCAGHGAPILEGASDQIRTLLEKESGQA
jgi:glyoxylase-like metal-dependent hydrolase (beta-lactamase superfamily II)